ncbi:putative ribonuclease H-like domain-containing protein [Tanacetum coccineum]
MAKKFVLKDMGKGTSHREVRPVWNNAQRINHQNKFVPSAVLTRSGRVPVSVVKQSSPRAQAAQLVLPRPAPNTRISNEKVNVVRVNGVNTVGQKAVCAVKGNGVTAVKALAGCVWRPKMDDLNKGNPQQTLKNKGFFDSGCSRHMTGNKDFQTDYQEIDGGFVAFGGSTRGAFDLKNVVPAGDLTCLFVKATLDESNLWHRRLGHVNFKTMNKLVRGNLVRGLPSKLFENDHTCVACQKGKQHKACLTDDFSRFSSVFFLATKDETSGILKRFITEIENQLNHKVKAIRCDNETEFKNKEMNELCGVKGIKREFSVARTPQQNGVAERKNRTLIEAARTMLADSLLPITFWAEAVNTACYVLNRVLVTKAQTKTPMNCKFDEKADEGFLVRYSVNSKAFRVFNTKTRKVEENLHVNFFENKPNMAGQGPNWLFDIDCLTNSMNYQPVTAGNQTNKNAGPQETNGDTGLKKNVDSSDEKDGDDTADDAAGKKTVIEPASKDEQAIRDALDKMLNQEKEATEQSNVVRKEFEAECNRELLHRKGPRASSINSFNIVSTPVNAANTFRGVNAASASGIFSAAGPSFVPLGGSFPINLPDDPFIPELEDIVEVQSTGIFGNTYDDDLDNYNTSYADLVVGAEADFNNMEHSTVVSHIPTTRIHSIHPKDQIIGDPKLAVQTRGMTKKSFGE